MKKVFAILAVAGFMAACNSGENQEAAPAETPATEVAAPDTTAPSTDTTAPAAPTEAPAAQ